MSPFSRTLEAVFRIRPGETRRVGLMFLYSLAIVSSFIVGRTVRDALFLSRYKVERLPLMYVGVAICVSIFSFTYGKFADRFRRDKLIEATLSIGLGLVGLIWMLLRFAPAQWMYPALYVFVEIMGVVTIVQFWTFANDIMSSREGKRLFGIIGAGGVLSNVVCGFPLGALAARVPAEDLLLLIVGLFSLAIVCVRKVAKDAEGEIGPKRRSSPSPSSSSSSASKGSFLATPHLMFIAGIVVLTVLTTTFIDYQLKVAAREAFAGKSDELASFFGYFYGFTGVLSCFVQFFLTTRLLERYGIVVSLMVLPSALVFGSIGLLLVPLVPGISAASLAKGAENVLRYTVNDSTMQLLYNPVPGDVRGRAKSFIDGVLKPMGIGVAGLALMGLSKSLSPLMFGHALASLDLAFALAWISLVVAIRKRYVSSLVATLRSRRLAPGSALRDDDTRKALEAALAGTDDIDVLHALELVPELGVKAPKLLTPLLTHRSTEIRLRAVELIGELGSRDAFDALTRALEDSEPGVRARAVRSLGAVGGASSLEASTRALSDASVEVRAAAMSTLFRYGGQEGIRVATEALRALVTSPEAPLRRAAATVLGSVASICAPSESFSILALFNDLLRDPDLSVRRAALEAAGISGRSELLPALFEAVVRRETARVARAALQRMAPQVGQELLSALRGTGTEGRQGALRAELVLVLARVGGEQASEAVVACMMDDDPAVRAAAATALAQFATRGGVRVPADTLRKAFLHTVARVLADAESLTVLTPPKSSLLWSALEERRKKQLAEAFRVLEALHPGAGLEIAFSNLRDGEKTRSANALEIIENVLTSEESRTLIPLIEDLEPTARGVMKALEASERTARSPDQCVRDLLADRSAWIRAVSIHTLLDVMPGRVSNLEEISTDPDPLVRESLISVLAVRELGEPGLRRSLLEKAGQDVNPWVRAAAGV